MNYSNTATNSTAILRIVFNWPVLILLCVIMLGLMGNLLVCIAIVTERRLRNVTNYFLFSLAVTDLLVSVLVMPLGLVAEFNGGRWLLGFFTCASYVYTDVFLCSCSIVHMTCISLDRYLGVSRPFEARNKSTLVVASKIAAVWLITLSVSCPLAVLTFVDPGQVYDRLARTCQIINPYFVIYGSTLTFVLPCTIMFVANVKTARLLRNRTPMSNVGPGGSKGASLRRTTIIKSARSEMIPIAASINCRRRSSTILCSTDNVISFDLRTPPCAKRSRYLSTASKSADVDDADCQRSIVQNRKLSSSRLSESVSSVEKYRNTLAQSRPSTNRRYSTELSSERKATRVLGFVFVCFFVCWAPFFAANLTTAFCTVLNRPCAVPRFLDSLFLWLGYVSSILNPVIYTAFNERFRSAFLRIISRHFCFCQRANRDADQHHQHYHRRPNSSFSYSTNNNRYLVDVCSATNGPID